MSNLDRAPALRLGGGLTDVAPRPVYEVFAGKEVLLGESTMVRRLLPNLGRRLVGAWCFVDHYGPDDIASAPGMQVPPHPHIGLQTVSWLLDGEVHHRDSLGSDQLIRPGELGLMTAGHAITHAEQSPVPHPALLHGVQLWVALPSDALTTPAAWQHSAALPVIDARGGTVTVIMGDVDGARSPGHAHSPLVGADVAVQGALRLPLEPGFEHAVLVMSGSVTIDDEAPLGPGAMAYLGCGRPDLRLTSDLGARMLLLGGAPFEEHIVMWWNFVGRSNDDIVAARAEWMDGDRFGDVDGFDGYRLPAPDLPPGRLKPGGATR
ncbi:MAG TPA: pirin family protein [Jatrophihabitans sp.]|uniref:pirin family protein n=1 Tax=Jatrophihabitans sp. TaxID=1932789 RepID=UPI002E0A7341|nr:pirin family protein [Jatrophihabitans sp.]